MKFRTLGSTDLKLSVIGLGTWAIGGGDWKFGWGKQDDGDAVACIRKAVELGINWIDTAAVYGFGKSESLVGQAVASLPPSQRPLIATKCGRTNLGGGEIGKSLRRQSVIDECEASLRRLGTECIDLYQMHWPEPDEQIEEGWETLVELKRQGKVRHIGVSNHNVSQMERLQAIHPIASLQPPYSLITRDIEADILPFCGQQQIGVIVYSPMGKGLLTGRFDADRAASLSEADHRSRDPRFQSPQLEVNLEFVKRLDEIADRLSWTTAELAIAWTLRRPELTAAIVGARRPDQIAETAAAGDRELDGSAIEEIEAAWQQRETDLAALGAVEKPRV